MISRKSQETGELRYKVVLGDSRSMTAVEDNSIHLVVTSPPYWQLKDYEAENQIGFHQEYDEYIAELDRVWGECERVLHPGCRLAVNIGDQFLRTSTYGRYRLAAIHADIIRGCVDLGLDFMGSIIWQKVTTMNTSGGGVVMGSFPYPRNGIVKVDYEHILLFKKLGEAPRPDPAQKELSRLSTQDWNRYFHGHWSFPGARQKDHIAVFPSELPRRLIRMFTFTGETVLDPFLGSGTTMSAARELGRSCTGYEINPGFLGTIRRRTGFGDQREFFRGEEALEVIRERSAVESFAGKPARAPIADAPGGYGSVIRKGDSPRREEYHRVQDVLDVRTIQLDDGRNLRLLGLTESDAGGGAARLRELVAGKQVYFKSDPGTDGKEGVYLYLRNRTCVNSRLIRDGVATVDERIDYRMKKRFLRYRDEVET